MRAVRIAQDIWWVGAVDWDLRDFHGFETPTGTTYNAYLVRGADGAALIDTVKAPFVDEMLARVREVMDLTDVTHIVVNHLEPDHTSGLPQVMAACPHARVLTSPMGERYIGEYHEGVQVERAGDAPLDLGGRDLAFLPVPMVHWPDSMMTWCAAERVLFPNDGFGQHVASSERFADELGCDRALDEAGTYFANILLPLRKQVGKAIEKVVEAGWAPEVIAPSHGVAWRGDDIGRVLDAYGRWVAGETRQIVVVAFGTMWESTRQLAHAVADGVAREGVECKVFDLAGSPFAEVTRAVMDGRALVVGSATLHRGMLYKVAAYLHYLGALHPEGKIGAVFGSQGWSGGACAQMRSVMEAMGLGMPFEDFTVTYRPTSDDLVAAAEWGAAVARAVKDTD